MRLATHRKLHYLLVDDDLEQADFVDYALRTCGSASKVTSTTNGKQALDLLKEQHKAHGNDRIDVVLLDINLPGMSGHEVLSRIRANPELAALPVVMLSSSSDPRDLSEAFEKHANGYVVKPIDFAEFNETIGGVDRYWSRCCRLPRREQ